MSWRKPLAIVMAIALLTAGLGIVVYVTVARDRLAPDLPAAVTDVPTWTPLPGASPTPHTYSATGLVREYTPGALIIVMTPVEGGVEQVIVVEGVRVERESGAPASSADIAPGQTLFAEGALDSIGRLIASRIVIVAGSPTATPTPSPSPTATPTLTPSPTVEPTATPTRTPMSAWEGEYFSNTGLRGAPAASREDVSIDFDWGAGAPLTDLSTDGFSIRWTTRRSLDAGTYHFYAIADDGVRVYVDDSRVIDAWEGQAGIIVFESVDLDAGMHGIRVEYHEESGPANVRVWWEKQGEYPDWRGEYYANPELSGAPAVVRNDADLQFDWGSGAPDASLPSDGFSARWTRTMLTYSGPHQVVARADDGVRVWLDGVLLLDAWDAAGSPAEGYIWLEQGLHELRVEYVEQSGLASLQVGWGILEQFAFWRGDYYANPDLAGQPAFSRDDQNIDFDWGTGAPYLGLPEDGFSVRWVRSIPLERGRYRFWAQSDDGVRVLVDGVEVIDQWQDGGPSLYEGEVSLDAGTHQVVVEYYEREQGALIRFGYVPALGSGPIATLTPGDLSPTAQPSP